MDPSDPNTLYAAMWQRERRKWADPRTEPGFTNSGVWKTTDAGKTWTRARRRPAARRTSSAASASTSPVESERRLRVRRQLRRAATRRRRTRAIRTASLIDYYPIGNEVYRSNDKGATWTKTSGQDDAQKLYMRNLSSSYGWVFGNIRVDPRDENTIYTLALGVSVSHDGGKTMGRIGAVRRPQVAAAAGCPGAPPRRRRPGRRQPRDVARSEGPERSCCIGNDSGFRISTDGGVTWTRANIPSSTFFDMAFDMDTPFRVYGSVQDHGSFRGVVDVRSGVAPLKPVAFESAPGGEGSTHAIDPTNPEHRLFGRHVRLDHADRPDAAAGPGAAPAAGRGARGNTKNIRPPAAPGERRAARPVAGADDPLAARSQHAVLRPAVRCTARAIAATRGRSSRPT